MANNRVPILTDDLYPAPVLEPGALVPSVTPGYVAVVALPGSLDDLTDVDAPAPVNGDVLQYDGGIPAWKNTPYNTLELNPPRYIDLPWQIGALQNAPGVSPPSWDATNMTLDFVSANSRDIFLPQEFDHSQVEGADGTLHIHVWNSTNGGGNVQWIVSHRVITPGIAVPAFTVNAPLLVPSGSTTSPQIITLATISDPTSKISSVYQIKIQRLINASDTYAGTVKMYAGGMHVQIDTQGSTAVNAK